MDFNKQNIVSIIVPVYKVENYLKRCVDSLINQSYKHIEIILVDDGSPDRCGEICDQYSLMDSRVRVIHKKNGGLSDARNYGIDIAKGDYILFVDSDDFIELDAIERLVTYAKEENLDIVCGDTYRVTEERNNTSMTKTLLFGGTTNNKVITGEEYLVDSINKKRYSVAVWTRMYSTELIKNNHIYFKKGILHEDEQWTPRVLLAAKKVGYLSFPFYNYIIREDSITQIADKKKHITDVISTCNELDYEYNKLNISKKSKKVLKDYLARLYMNTCTFGKYDSEFYTDIISKKFPLRNAWFIKTRVEVIVYALSISLYRYIKVRFS